MFNGVVVVIIDFVDENDELVSVEVELKFVVGWRKGFIDWIVCVCKGMLVLVYVCDVVF